MSTVVARGYHYARENPLTVAMTILGIALAVFIFRSEQTRTIVYSSPCVTNPYGQACEDTRERVLRAEDPNTTCILFTNVGYACPNPAASPAQRERQGVNNSSGSTPPSQPGPPSGGPPDTQPGPSGPTPDGPPTAQPNPRTLRLRPRPRTTTWASTRRASTSGSMSQGSTLPSQKPASRR